MPYYDMSSGMHSHRHPFYGQDELQQEPLVTPKALVPAPCACHHRKHHGHHGHGRGMLIGALTAALVIGGVYFVYKLVTRPTPGPVI